MNYLISPDTNNQANLLLTHLNYIHYTTPNIFLKLRIKFLTFKLQKYVNPPDFNIMLDDTSFKAYRKSLDTFLELIGRDIKYVKDNIDNLDPTYSYNKASLIKHLSRWCVKAIKLRF